MLNTVLSISVSILVLVDAALRLRGDGLNGNAKLVSILVLVDAALRHCTHMIKGFKLILFQSLF